MGCALGELRAHGFELLVIDERPDWNTVERFPFARRHLVMSHDDALAELELKGRDYVVIATHNHDFDREILSSVIGTGRWLYRDDRALEGQKVFKELRLEGLMRRSWRALTSGSVSYPAETPRRSPSASRRAHPPSAADEQ